LRVKRLKSIADMSNVTLELSTPVKIVALAGLVLVLAAGGFASYSMIAKKSRASDIVPSATPGKTAHHSGVVQFTQTHTRPARTHTAPARVVIDGNLPAPLHHALRANREVVAVLTAPGVPGDAGAVQEARAGAAAAHVGFTVLNVTQETLATTLAAWAPNAGDGSVLVVERPGTIAVELDGYADRQMVAQAALEPR
jgi:hypothetical protein